MFRSVKVRSAIAILVLQTCSVAMDASHDAIAKSAELFKAGDIKRAEAVLRAASAADPSSADLHGALGELLLKTHNYEDSVEQLGLATQEEPDSAAFNLLLSEALIGWKHYGVALDFLNAVRSKFSQEPQFHYDLGLTYYDMNKMNEARAEFEQAVQMAPQFERAQFMLAISLGATGDTTKAADLLHALLKAQPGNVVYLSTLAQILGPLGGAESAEAVRDAHRALALDPRDAHIQFVAATVLSETGDFAGARPLLEHLEKVDPKVLAVHVQLARVYARLGQRELAKKETGLASQLQKQGAPGNQPAANQPEGATEPH